MDELWDFLDEMTPTQREQLKADLAADPDPEVAQMATRIAAWEFQRGLDTTDPV